MRDSRFAGLRFMLCALALLAGLATTPAQAADDPPFVGVFIDKAATLSDEAVEAAMGALVAREADPEHVVVIIHGFATSRETSAKEYTQVSRDVIKEYQALGRRVSVLGIQWDSDVGSVGDWLPKVIFGGRHNPYLEKVALGLDVGHVGLRQVLLRLQQRFPKARLDVFGHSLGCQLALCALGPHFDATRGVKGKLQAFKPDTPLHANLVCLAGADVDYDAVARSGARVKHDGVAELFWLTLAGRGTFNPFDAVLVARKFLRGDLALGNQLPRFTCEQIDDLCSKRRLVLDTKDIPPKHEFTRYYSAARVKRLAAMSVALYDSAHPSDLLKALDKVIAAPAMQKNLVEFLRSTDNTVQYYTLWRLENLLCGHAAHLSDGYLSNFANTFQDRPDQLEAMRLRSPCKVVTSGIWPTTWQLQRVLDTMPGAHLPAGPSAGFDSP